MKLETKECWCGEKQYKKFYNGFWFADNQKIPVEIGECSNCGTIRTILCFFREKEPDSIFPYSKLSIRHMDSIKTIIKFLNGESVLDIGCNSGQILDHLQKNTSLKIFDGIDLNSNFFKNNKNEKINLSSCCLKDLTKKYQNVIMVHSFEHIMDFDIFFEDLKTVLCDESMIYICVPNIQSAMAKNELFCWGAMDPTEHFWHFSAGTLQNLMKKKFLQNNFQYIGTSRIWCANDQLEVVLKYENH